MNPAFTGLILAGGASRRMGTDKAFLVPGDGGPPLVERSRLALLEAGAEPILAIGGDGPRLEALDLTVLPDREADQGPLVGLVTGLRAAPTATAVVLTCDMPEIDAATVARLIATLEDDPTADGVLPVDSGRRQVLTAAYRTSIADHLDQFLATGERSVRRALEGLSILEVEGIDPRHLADLDRPSDLDHYARTNRRRAAASGDPVHRRE